MPLKRFGVSLEDNLLESLDQYVSENGFANRSQAIRFLVEKNVAEKKWQCNHIVAGRILLPGLPIFSKIIRMLSCLLPNIM